mmetsp:Transcript_81767/g.212734  ORF Transcript_81767/g.212734 Transcript_81767/m.212734 type:complete len:231 (+) Transcript_81767:22-714(+)
MSWHTMLVTQKASGSFCPPKGNAGQRRAKGPRGVTPFKSKLVSHMADELHSLVKDWVSFEDKGDVFAALARQMRLSSLVTVQVKKKTQKPGRKAPMLSWRCRRNAYSGTCRGTWQVKLRSHMWHQAGTCSTVLLFAAHQLLGQHGLDGPCVGIALVEILSDPRRTRHVCVDLDVGWADAADMSWRLDRKARAVLERIAHVLHLLSCKALHVHEEHPLRGKDAHVAPNLVA